jgi:tetratricopeptide (TPR) repeat protein
MTTSEVDQACQRFFDVAVRPKRNVDFEQEWLQRDPSDPYYFSLAYFCVCAVLDDEATRNDPAYLRDAAEVLRYIEENDRDYQNGSVNPWSRLGDVYRSLGKQEEAIQTYSRGIDTLTRAFDWKVGELLPAEANFGLPYSNVELLYARRGRSELELSRYGDAARSLETAFKSLRKRGVRDMVNAHFPDGIETLLESARTGKTTVVERTSLSSEQEQFQKQGTSFARMISRMISRFFGR